MSHPALSMYRRLFACFNSPHPLLTRSLRNRINSSPAYQTRHHITSSCSAVTEPQPIYHFQEDVETLEAYEPGGLHPVHIGDRYQDGRYEIVHKLGFGSFSTVWLAKDHLNQTLVALKMLLSEFSRSSMESKILRSLSQGKLGHPGRPFVSTPTDEFFVNGPNGRHRCLVSEATRCSIARSKEASPKWMFQPNIARAIAAQVLLGLAYVHSCGVIHGDLHLSNILLRTQAFRGGRTLETIYGEIGQPQHTAIERLDGCINDTGVPKYSVLPAMIGIASDQVKEPQILISDFGEASTNDSKPKTLHTPTLFLPPEAIFNESLGQPVDIWTAGCSLYEILGERPLFEGFMPDSDHTVAEMISTLGPLPRRWWDTWQKKEDFFLKDGSWKKDTTRGHAPYSRPLAERLYIMGRGRNPATCEFNVSEMAALEKLLRAILTYDPQQRITAQAAIESEWMVRWGLPALRDPKSSA